jgi:uncharacterized membrane protein
MTEHSLQQGDESWLQDEPADPAPSSGQSVEGTVAWPLIVAGAGLIVGLATLGGGVALQIFGYLSASLLLFTAVAWFRRSSSERDLRHGVSTPSSLNALALALLLAGFAVALVHAWNIAIHFS